MIPVSKCIYLEQIKTFIYLIEWSPINTCSSDKIVSIWVADLNVYVQLKRRQLNLTLLYTGNFVNLNLACFVNLNLAWYK